MGLFMEGLTQKGAPVYYFPEERLKLEGTHINLVPRPPVMGSWKFMSIPPAKLWKQFFSAQKVKNNLFMSFSKIEKKKTPFTCFKDIV